MTPTELITAVHALKIIKDATYGSIMQEFENVMGLRNLIFNSADVHEEIKKWMNEEPIVSLDEVIEFKRKDGQ